MRNELLGVLTPFKNKTIKVTEYQQTEDIISQLLKGHKKWATEYDKISDRFWTGSVVRSCQNVFNFLKKNVRYKIEPDTRQSIKSPAAIIATGQNGYNDCKHYSNFFGGLIDSWNRKKYCNVDWCYRFANYKLLSEQPHHVFVVIKKKDNEIWCDAVLDKFNLHKPYFNKIDKKPQMALYQISGVGCESCSYRMQQISGKKQKREGRRYGENCKGRTVPKYAPPLVAGRKAFLALIRLNIGKLGLKMYHVLQNPVTRKKAIEKWCALGGNGQMLVKTVERFAVKYKRKHGQIGFAPAALLASAAPILAAINPIIKLASSLAPDGSRAREVLEAATEAGESLQEAGENSGGGETTSGFNYNYLYAALALGGIYYITKKKK